MPMTVCSLDVTKETLVLEAIAEALKQFGLDPTVASRYNLVEVSLEKGTAGRIALAGEQILQLLRNLRKVFLLFNFPEKLVRTTH